MSALDTDLLERAVAGDGGALRTLLERHGPMVWGEIQRDIGPLWRAALGERHPSTLLQMSNLAATLRKAGAVADAEALAGAAATTVVEVVPAKHASG